LHKNPSNKDFHREDAKAAKKNKKPPDEDGFKKPSLRRSSRFSRLRG
jgi:hypothetical protein